jgi:hypothetical protein
MPDFRCRSRLRPWLEPRLAGRAPRFWAPATEFAGSLKFEAVNFCSGQIFCAMLRSKYEDCHAQLSRVQTVRGDSPGCDR